MIEYDTEAACFRPLPLGRAVFASSLLLEEALSIRVRGAGERGPPFMGHVVRSCVLTAKLTAHLLVGNKEPFSPCNCQLLWSPPWLPARRRWPVRCAS